MRTSIDYEPLSVQWSILSDRVSSHVITGCALKAKSCRTTAQHEVAGRPIVSENWPRIPNYHVLINFCEVTMDNGTKTRKRICHWKFIIVSNTLERGKAEVKGS